LANAPIEIIDGDRGKNYPSQADLLPQGHCLFLSTKNVRAAGFDFSECQFITQEKDGSLRKGKIQRNDVILTTRGTVGNIAFYSTNVPYENIRINSGMLILRPNISEINPLFNFYLIQVLRSTFDTVVSGSAQPQLPIKDLISLEILLPPISEQKAIAAVLSSLDDKIDLLHRQNATLEAMAEALFRQWFLVEAREKWESAPLSYFGKVVCGKTPSKANKYFFGGEIPFIKIPDMHGKIFIDKTSDTLTEEGASSQANKYIPPDSICVSCIATVGLVSMTKAICQTNQQINTIIPSYSFYRHFLFFYLRLLKDELENMASGGTATPNLNTGDFSRIEILSPCDSLLKNFDNKVRSLFEKINSNQAQISTLEKFRDTLLPKLMTGEIKVV